MESDDVWDDDDGSQQNELDREWEARRQQYYNVSDRGSCIEPTAALIAAQAIIGCRLATEMASRKAKQQLCSWDST